MRLLEVNDVSLLGVTHQEAVNCLRTAGQQIHMIVCKGYDKAEVERLVNEGKLRRDSRSISQSVSSLDRDDEDSEVFKQEMEIKKELAEWENQEKLLKEELENMELDEVKEKSTQEKVNIYLLFTIINRSQFSFLLSILFTYMYHACHSLGFRCCKSC